jgi:hypothetical protein
MRMKSRRGAFVVITGVLFIMMVGFGAVAVDFSRMWTLKNELQTSADAAATAGAIQLAGTHVTTGNAPADSARAYATRNPAMARNVVVDSVELGHWNHNTRTFTPGGTPTDAIHVVVANPMQGLLMTLFGVTPPRIRARATGWAGAPVATSGCQKPWAIPYENLMYAINAYRGIANTTANMNRAFDQVADIAALQAMTQAQRTFDLKIAQNNNNNNGQINQTAATTTSMPGNYQAVRLGKWWDYATQSIANPPPGQGGNDYLNNITGANGCYTLSVGDSLETETGNKVGPTLNGMEPAVCTTIVNSGPNEGDCLNSAGTVGVDIKASFFRCGTGCSGQAHVGIELLGSFTLTKVYPNNSGGHEKSEIAGIFVPIQSSGPVGGGSTTLQRPILVQ